MTDVLVKLHESTARNLLEMADHAFGCCGGAHVLPSVREVPQKREAVAKETLRLGREALRAQETEQKLRRATE